MSLLWIDGFDHYATANISSLYSTTASPSVSSSSGRRGGGAMEIPLSSSGSENFSLNITQGDVFIIGFAFKMTAYPAADKRIVTFKDAGTSQCGFGLNNTGKILVYRGSTIIATSADSLFLGVWNYIEYKVTIHNTTGAYEVRINGANAVSASNVDTQQTTNALADTLQMGGDGTILTNVTWLMDDFYVCDDAGSVNNDFLGDCRVDTILPNTDGNYTSWTPSTGTTHSTLVDDVPPNTTDYNSDATVTNKDSYGLANLPTITSQTIHGMMMSVYAVKTDAGARSLKVGVRSGTTDSIGSAKALSVDYLYCHNIQEIDPNTASAWTESGVNAAEIIVETA